MYNPQKHQLCHEKVNCCSRDLEVEDPRHAVPHITKDWQKAIISKELHLWEGKVIFMCKGHFHWKIFGNVWRDTMAKTRGNKGHCLCGLQVLPGLDYTKNTKLQRRKTSTYWVNSIFNIISFVSWGRLFMKRIELGSSGTGAAVTKK